MRVHVIQTGRLVGNKTYIRGQTWGSMARRRADYEFPVLCYLLEHPEGLIMIDAGAREGIRAPRVMNRFVPTPVVTAEEEVGPQMRARGLDPRDVRRVVVTHLDWDHVGGIHHFPNAEVLVHRPEHDFARTRLGRGRYMPSTWPDTFEPRLYDLEPAGHGPFPQSLPITDAGDVRIVPLPGHSIAQVGVLAQDNGATLLFGADHVLRQDWFLEDAAGGNLVGLGHFFRDAAVETSRRIQAFARATPTVLLPSHDADGPARLAAGTTL